MLEMWAGVGLVAVASGTWASRLAGRLHVQNIGRRNLGDLKTTLEVNSIPLWQ